MSSSFIGQIGSASTLRVNAGRQAAQGRSVRDFDGGRIEAGPSVHTFESNGAWCLAVGTPRFTDTALAAVARAQGPAAAWLQAFRAYRQSAPARVGGRFAVVVLAPARHEAWLATDRFGTWPVCYATDAEGLSFSDRADTVPGAGQRLSSQALFEYLYYHVIPAPRTVFDGVWRLPAGHVLEWSGGVAHCAPWWTPVFDEADTADFEHSKQHFRRLVEEAVARETTGPATGAFLSGGTDSSTVAGTLCKVLGEPAHTYSIGFDADGYDEMAYARLAARHFGAKHHEYYVRPDDLLDGMPRVATHYDQPFGNCSAVPAWICACRARDDGIDKLLAGDGGDELFGGNSRYAKQRIFGWYEALPGVLRRALVEPLLALPGMKRVPLVKKGASYVEQARTAMPDRMQMYNLLERLGGAALFEPEFAATIDPAAALAQQREVWHSPQATSLINRMLAWDWKYILADKDLPKVVGSTQLAGIDVGFPLLGDELVEFSLSIPPEWKLRGLTLRWFFKEALRGFLPDEIIAKKKHGFGLPFGVWACGHDGLRAQVRDTFGSLKSRRIVRPQVLDALLETHLPAHPGYFGEFVWTLMMLELWLRGHDRGRLTIV